MLISTAVLIDWQIRNLCEHGMIEPFNPEHINPSSVDICIGNTAMIDTEDGFKDYPLFGDCNINNPYYMEPNECMLVSTLETLKLPPYITCGLKLKSSRAREGLSHALAGHIDNGFHGILTLELKNYSTKHKVKIYPGLRVGQLIVYNTDIPNKTYENGRYAGHDKVMGSLDAGVLNVI